MARSLVATEIGVKRAKEALIDLGITQTVLAEKRLKYSRSTVSNFFNRKPIAHENFTEICKILKLEWRDIAEIAEGEATQDDAPESSATAASSKSAKEEFQQIDDKVKQVEKQIRLAFAIAGTVNQVDEAKLNAIVKLLRQITGDASIEIVDIQEGSIKLILTGTPEALVKIQTLYRSGRLEEIEGTSVVNVDFENLIRANFREANLFEAELSGANLREANFIGANLIGANLIGANLRNANLIGANLIGANLRNTNLRNADLRKANISLVGREPRLFRTAPAHSNLFKEANFSGADLRGADLRGASLRGANFSGASLGRNLRTEFKISLFLNRVNPWETDLNETDLNETDLSGADLSGADLSRADLSGVNLRGADLRGANLRGANLIKADLCGANLRGANLSKAIFESKRLFSRGISKEMKRDLISRGAIFDD